MTFCSKHQSIPVKMTAVALLSLSLSLSLTTRAFAQSEADKQKSSDLPMMELAPELETKQQPAERSVSAGDKVLEAKAVVVDVNSKTLTYDPDRDAYIATGAVHVVISEQNSELFADQVIYDQNQNLLIAEGHVVIQKNGDKTLGTYAKIDLTRQSALINDVSTRVDQVRIKAQQGMLANEYQVFENGRLIITPNMLGSVMGKTAKKGQLVNQNTKKAVAKAIVKKGQQASAQRPSVKTYDPFAESSLATLATTDPVAAGIDERNVQSPETVDLQNADSDNWDNEFLHVKAKEINLYRWKDGYAKVDVKKPSLYAGRFKLATLSDAQFSQDMTQDTEYLGPDMGFDPDMGGFYYGPGYDFRLGEGSVRFSPFASYGSGYRKRRGGNRFEKPGVGPGIGGAMHYRSSTTKLDLAYNSKVEQPVGYFERTLFDKKTRIIGSVNEDYINGFMGFERPGAGIMLADTRQVADWGNYRVDTFSTIGVFKDDFFPNNKAADFVDFDRSQDPATAGRIQFQAQFTNKQPIFKVGDWLHFGVNAQVAGAGYTTGDLVGIIRGGPTLSLKYKDRWRTSFRYFYAQTSGETPFLFDSYYYGRQQLTVSNYLKMNEYISLGLQSQLSLNRDNAKGDLFTGNQLSVLVGPKSVKLNLAYDVVRQRSYFGLTFMPGKGGKPIDYDTLRVFSPDQYQPH